MVHSLEVSRMTQSPGIISGFQRISSQVYIYEPKLVEGLKTRKERGSNEDASLPPETVILFTWADASFRHLSKYVTGYQDLYPFARIIIVLATTLGTFYSGQAAAQKVVKGVISQELFESQSKQNQHLPCSHGNDLESSNLQGRKQALLDLAGNGLSSPSMDAPKAPILVHAFSNSGCINLEAACSVWLSVQESLGEPASPLPLTALILDSTPGGTSFRREFPRWSKGISIGIASSLPFMPTMIVNFVAAVIVTVLMGVPRLLGFESLPSRGRRALNSVMNIPVDTARLYIYSKEDPLIGWRDVESHAEEARSLGYKKVDLEKFVGSTHVGHMRKDPERYWATIHRFWAESVEGKRV